MGELAARANQIEKTQTKALLLGRWAVLVGAYTLGRARVV